MKIIDERGRVFGRINFIDFLVILFLLCAVPMFYFGHKAMTRKIPEPEKEFNKLEIDCEFIKLKPEISKIISVGDKELDEKGRVIAEIVSIGKIAPYTYEFNIGSNQSSLHVDVFLKQVPATLTIMAELKDSKLFYKGKQILEGSIVSFKTDNYQAEARILFKTKFETKPKELALPKEIVDIKKTINTLKQSQDRADDAINTLKQSQDRADDAIDVLEKKVNAILSAPKIKKLIKQR